MFKRAWGSKNKNYENIENKDSERFCRKDLTLPIFSRYCRKFNKWRLK